MTHNDEPWLILICHLIDSGDLKIRRTRGLFIIIGRSYEEDLNFRVKENLLTHVYIRSKIQY